MLYLFVAIGLAFTALFGALGFEHSRVVTWRDRAHAAEANLEAAQKRATALALLWSAQVDKTEAAERRASNERREQFSALEDRVKSLPRDSTCAAGRDVDGLLRDITAAANAAGVATVGGADPDAVPRSAEAARAKR